MDRCMNVSMKKENQEFLTHHVLIWTKDTPTRFCPLFSIWELPRSCVCMSLCACRCGLGVTEKGLQNPSATHSWWGHRGQYTLCVCIIYYTLLIWKHIHYSRLCAFQLTASPTHLRLTTIVVTLMFASAKVQLFPSVRINQSELIHQVHVVQLSAPK